jgi:hypothetical protein
MGILESKFWKIFCEMAGHNEWIEKAPWSGREAENLHRKSQLFSRQRRGMSGPLPQKTGHLHYSYLEISEVKKTLICRHGKWLRTGASGLRRDEGNRCTAQIFRDPAQPCGLRRSGPGHLSF